MKKERKKMPRREYNLRLFFFSVRRTEKYPPEWEQDKKKGKDKGFKI